MYLVWDDKNTLNQLCFDDLRVENHNLNLNLINKITSEGYRKAIGPSPLNGGEGEDPMNQSLCCGWGLGILAEECMDLGLLKENWHA